MAKSGFALFEQFSREAPALVLEWNDAQLGAKGWLVINSLRGGAAGGGTRMVADGTVETAKFLAKTMEVKFRVSGPDIGGAKSVIRFDPGDAVAKREVLRRWFAYIRPYLHQCYGTGGDLNVDLSEVEPAAWEMAGVGHPQEGAVRGHFGDESVSPATERLRRGLVTPVETPIPGSRVADLVTGFGLWKAVEAYCSHVGEEVAGKRVVIQGLGAVGGAAAYYLHRAGARIVGVATEDDHRGVRVLTDPRGIDVPGLLPVLEKRRIPAESASATTSDALWALEADVFVPAANSFVLNRETLSALESAGVGLIACGANDPFADGMGDTVLQQWADERFAILPDFVANCGMARTFAVLMGRDERVDPEWIFGSVERTVSGALDKIMDGDRSRTGLLDRAYRIFVAQAMNDAGAPVRPARLDVGEALSPVTPLP